MNHSDFPIQINSSSINHQSKMVSSMFVTSNNKNHANLYPSSFFTSSHVSKVSSSSLRTNMVSPFSMPFIAQTSGFVNYSQVFITQTIAKRYHALIPTSNMVIVQNDNDRVNRFMTSYPPILKSTVNPPNDFDKHYETFTPKPIDFFCSQQDYACRQHLDIFSSSPKHYHEQYVHKNGRSVKYICKPTEVLEEIHDEIDYEKDGGWIYSLPFEKDSSFICLKCNSLFDTSQMLVVHTELIHSKNETKKRLKLHHQEFHGKSHKINKDQTGGQSCRRKLRQ
ncbi:putative transcription factor C2H2 family [Arabidopsis thaliana]